MTQITFSFHNRNERTATRAGDYCLQHNFPFQFPQSERTNCNFRIPNTCGRAKRAFSFHNRNERTATDQPTRASTPNVFNFQFPQSERTNCNRSFTNINDAREHAFSFHNRNERTATQKRRTLSLSTRHLSVSTIGTNELQPPRTSSSITCNSAFSFHNRNERTATYSRARQVWQLRGSFSFHNRNERTAT